MLVKIARQKKKGKKRTESESSDRSTDSQGQSLPKSDSEKGRGVRIR